jgi:predicted O-linked N-acetylglucosamine transferase (SPINDLY family)
VLVVFEGRDPALTACFRERLARSGVPAARLHVTKPVPHADFLRINSLCDVMLDTLRWSGGNTSLDALACGLPIVTLPGRFMRGRQSFGMLTLMGLADLVARDAADYASKAAAIATNRTHRDHLSARIRAAHGRVFDDPAPVTALAEFLRR